MYLYKALNTENVVIEPWVKVRNHAKLKKPLFVIKQRFFMLSLLNKKNDSQPVTDVPP